MKTIISRICCLIVFSFAFPAAAADVSLRSTAASPLSLALLDTLKIPVSERDKIRLKSDLQYIAREEVMGEKQWQRRKIPKVAILSNMVLPGLGQVYNGRRLKTVVMVGLTTFYMGEAWLNYKRAIYREKARDRYAPNTTRWYFHDNWHDYHEETAKDFLWWSGAVWIIGMLDAYIDAHLFDLRGYVPESENKQANYLTLSMSF